MGWADPTATETPWVVGQFWVDVERKSYGPNQPKPNPKLMVSLVGQAYSGNFDNWAAGIFSICPLHKLFHLCQPKTQHTCIVPSRYSAITLFCTTPLGVFQMFEVFFPIFFLLYFPFSIFFW
jgi:hypothetical protein